MKKLLLISTGIMLVTAQNLVAQAVFAQEAAPQPVQEAGMMPPPMPHMPPPPPPPVMRMITVDGESREQFSPDQAILSMSLVSKDDKLDTAKVHNDALVERLVNISREFNIPKENLATSNIYISPEYRYDQEGKEQVLTGYIVSRQLRVTMDSLDIHERLLSAIVNAKIDQVNGIEFRLKDPEKHAAKLRVKAFENAKAKAQALAEAAGAKLGKAMIISTISGGDNVVHPPMPMRGMAKAAMAEMSVAPSLPGMIELSESVNATFTLE
jgi:uncharacterized protein YggE